MEREPVGQPVSAPQLMSQRLLQAQPPALSSCPGVVRSAGLNRDGGRVPQWTKTSLAGSLGVHMGALHLRWREGRRKTLGGGVPREQVRGG